LPGKGSYYSVNEPDRSRTKDYQEQLVGKPNPLRIDSYLYNKLRVEYSFV